MENVVSGGHEKWDSVNRCVPEGMHCDETDELIAGMWDTRLGELGPTMGLFVVYCHSAISGSCWGETATALPRYRLGGGGLSCIFHIFIRIIFFLNHPKCFIVVVSLNSIRNAANARSGLCECLAWGRSGWGVGWPVLHLITHNFQFIISKQGGRKGFKGIIRAFEL